ncbi:MAG: GNAT family N-acetyltransferase [Oscillospiraceae bacterium]|nr:GNAT family N-acetyltransferase [Oscillospiraceae bacterium]
MTIHYTNARSFTAEQLERLFLSVNWESGKYPERLLKALQNCDTVYTAWDGDKLVGLISAIDDGEIAAYVHYLLVDPEYQGIGLGSALLHIVKEKYRNYLHFFLVAEHKALVEYYERLGFEQESEATVMVYKERQNNG